MNTILWLYITQWIVKPFFPLHTKEWIHSLTDGWHALSQSCWNLFWKFLIWFQSVVHFLKLYFWILGQLKTSLEQGTRSSFNKAVLGKKIIWRLMLIIASLSVVYYTPNYLQVYKDTSCRTIKDHSSLSQGSVQLM